MVVKIKPNGPTVGVVNFINTSLLKYTEKFSEVIWLRLLVEKILRDLVYEV